MGSLLYSAYIHTNGKIQVKGMPFGENLIDRSSPFVKTYLGELTANNYDEAIKLFEEKVKEIGEC